MKKIATVIDPHFELFYDEETQTIQAKFPDGHFEEVLGMVGDERDACIYAAKMYNSPWWEIEFEEWTEIYFESV